ncbi:MAG: DNA-binding domain-containing protein [Pseudomonadota bacterium]
MSASSTFHRDFAEAVAAADVLARPPHLDASLKPRFDVYRNNYFHGLSLSLRDAYPCVHKVVGDAFFMAMAREYLANNPPKARTLVLFGEEFPEFLDTFEPSQPVVYLADLARVERAVLESLHERDAPFLAPEHIQELGDALLERRFAPHPAVRLVESTHPIVAIWQANQSDASAEQRVIPGRAETALITRPQFQTQTHCLVGADKVFIAGLLANATVEEAFSNALAADSRFDSRTAWQALLGSGALASL